MGVSVRQMERLLPVIKKRGYPAEKKSTRITTLDSYWSRNMESDDVVPISKSER